MSSVTTEQTQGIHPILGDCWPQSSTLARHWPNSGTMPRVCWVVLSDDKIYRWLDPILR